MSDGEFQASNNGSGKKEGRRTPESANGFRRLMHDLHDFGIMAMLGKFRESVSGFLLLYHDWDFHDWERENPLLGDGHVLNVVRGTDLAGEAQAWAKEKGVAIPRFINFYDQAAQYFSSQQHLKWKPAEEELTQDERDTMDALSAWEGMNEAERDAITIETAKRATEAHDLANLIKNVNDWNALKDSSRRTTDPVNPADPQSLPIVEYYDRMQYDGVEEKEATMFKQSLDAFQKELGFSNAQLAVAKALGAEWIRKTAFVPDNLPEGLAGTDQTAAAFNPRALWSVFGLVNEYRVRVAEGDVLKVPDFNPKMFFGGFIPWRFEILDKAYGRESGTTMHEYLKFMSDYKRENEGAFADLVGVPKQSQDQVRGITNLETFVTERFKMQQEAAKLFWPEGKVRYEDAFKGWSMETFQKMESVSKLFQEHFWDPSFTVDAFQNAIASPATQF